MNKPLRLKNNDPKIFYTYCSHCKDKSGHMEVDLHQGVYYCHKCGHGDQLRTRPDELPQPGRNKLRLVWDPPLPVSKPFEFYHTTPLLLEDRRYAYLLARGFSDETIRDILKPVVVNFDPFMVFFPVLDREGNMVYVVGRRMSATPSRKWWFPPSRPDRLGKSHFFWGLHQFREALFIFGGGSRIVLVEGIFDAAWDNDRLAMFGSSPSLYQLKILQDLQPQEVIIAFDGDARERGFEVGAMVARYLSVPIWVALLPTDQDPDTLGIRGTDYINKVKVRMV